MGNIVDELISNCLKKDDDLESLNKWDNLYYDKSTDSYYKIRSYEVRFDTKAIQKELDDKGYHLNAILDLDFCFPQYKKSRYHLYKLSKQPSDVTVITYKGGWNKGLKQIQKAPSFNRFALTQEQRNYLDNVLDKWLCGTAVDANASLFKIETVSVNEFAKKTVSTVGSERETVIEEMGEELLSNAQTESDGGEEENDEVIIPEVNSEQLFTEYAEEIENKESSPIDYSQVDDQYQAGCSYYYDEGDVAKAVHYFTEAAENGDMDAQYILGTIYFRGELGSPDYEQARSYFNMAAVQSDADSQNWLGWMYYKGLGVKPDIDMAARWYEVAAKQGLADAQFNYGCLYYLKDNPKRNENKALEWFKKASSHGDKRAALMIEFINEMKSSKDEDISVEEPDDDFVEDDNLMKYKAAVDYLKGNTDEQGIATAVEYLTELADNGHVQSQFELGALYMRGGSTIRDEDKAKRYLLMAYDNGHALAGTYLASIYLESDDDSDVTKGIELLKEARVKGSIKASLILAKMYLNGDRVEKDIDLAMNIYEDLSSIGNSTAQYQLGYIYFNGNEKVEKDPVQGIKWLDQSANKGNPSAMEYLGMIFLEGKSSKRYPDLARHWLEKAKESGAPNADYYLGWMYYKGIGVDVDYDKGEEYFLTSAENGNLNAMVVLGNLYLITEWDGYDPDAAIGWYTKAVDRGRYRCCIDLGSLYIEGKHIEQDIPTAIGWFDRAVQNGFYDAYYTLGLHYYIGAVVTKDFERAAHYFQIALDGGDEKSRIMLSKMYNRGQYFDKDEAKAAELLEKSKMDESHTLYTLGLYYKNGEGVDKDVQKTVELFTKASEMGHKKAQYELGWMYYRGTEIPVDMELAEKYIRMAAEQAHAEAEFYLYKILNDKGDAEGIDWLVRSAEHGSNLGKYRLAREKIYGKVVEKDIPGAIELLEQLVEVGDRYAPRVLGDIYLSEEGFKDIEKGQEVYLKAIEKGNMEAASELGVKYWKGVELPQDYALAVKYTLMAGDNNIASGFQFLSREYENGKYVEKDDKKSFDYSMKAAMMGHLPSIYQVGWKYGNGSGVEQDMEESFRWYLKSAEQGFGQGEYSVAWCYYRGRGVEKDHKKAKYWFLKAAESSQNKDQKAKSYRQLAIIGTRAGTEESMKEARGYFEKAVECGDVSSMIELAEMCIKGKIDVPDLEKGKEYLLRAKESKCSPEQSESIEKMLKEIEEKTPKDVELDKMYFKAKKMLDSDPPQEKEAFDILFDAAMKGHKASQNMVAYMYKNGIGVPVDKKKASEWWSMARN